MVISFGDRKYGTIKFPDRLPPQANLVAWWEADYAVTPDTTAGTTTAASVGDRTGTANNNLIQGTKTNQPLLAIDNGKATLSFDGSNDYLIPSGAAYAAKMIVVVFKKNTANFSEYNGIITARSSVSLLNSNSNETIGITGIPGANALYAMSAAATDCYLDGKQRTIHSVNDYQSGIVLPGNSTGYHCVTLIQSSSATGAKFWAIGADVGGIGTRYFNGFVRAVLIYNTVDLAIRNQAEAALMAKYSVPVDSRAYAHFFGDSITVGSGTSKRNNCWAFQAATTLDRVEANRGINSSPLQNTSPVFSGNGRDRYATDLAGAELVFILYGTNDIFRVNLGCTPALFQNDYSEIIAGLIAMGVFPANITLGSPPWLPDAGYLNGSNRTLHLQYVAATRAVAVQYGCKYANVYQAMADGGGATLISGDNIHPNDAGHNVIKAAMLAATIPTS